MARNYVILRRSPDWRTFDIQETRVFLRQFSGMAEDMIIRFAEVWDMALALDFLAYRHEMKALSLACAYAVKDAIVLGHAELANLIVDDDDLLFFTDDDDWTAPHLFQSLRAYGEAGDGWLWRSIFVGKLFGDTPYEKRGDPIVQERPASDVVYTNNYAVSGSAWKRLGPDRLLEHYWAQQVLDEGAIQLRRSDDYLTAANKHLCCTVAVNHNGQSPAYLSDLRGAVGQVVAEVEAFRPGERIDWITGPLARFALINRSALGQS